MIGEGIRVLETLVNLVSKLQLLFGSWIKSFSWVLTIIQKKWNYCDNPTQYNFNLGWGYIVTGLNTHHHHPQTSNQLPGNLEKWNFKTIQDNAISNKKYCQPKCNNVNNLEQWNFRTMQCNVLHNHTMQCNDNPG